MVSNSRKRQREAHHPEPSNPNAKRKVALLLAYSGTRYQGLQKNPGAVTVEGALEAAIHRAGGITDENFGTLQKVSWSRAGRTDKGVHAVGQIIGLKLVGPGEPACRTGHSSLAWPPGAARSRLPAARRTQDEPFGRGAPNGELAEVRPESPMLRRSAPQASRCSTGSIRSSRGRRFACSGSSARRRASAPTPCAPR